MASFKVEIKSVGESSFASSGIRLVTEQQANAYAHDLMSRYFAVDLWRVVPSEDKPNHTADEFGRLTRINEVFSVSEIMSALDKTDLPAVMQSQIFRHMQALEHLVSEAKYINETVNDGETFAHQVMQAVTKAENILDGGDLTPDWKE